LAKLKNRYQNPIIKKQNPTIANDQLQSPTLPMSKSHIWNLGIGFWTLELEIGFLIFIESR